MISLVQAHTNDDGTWNDFVTKASHGSIFYHSKWLDILEKRQDISSKRYFILHNKDLVGVFPYFTRSYVLFRVAASPYYLSETPYLGPLLQNGLLDKETLDAIAAHLRKEGFFFYRLVLPPGVSLGHDPNPGTVVKTKHTHVLDLSQSEKQLWMNLEPRCRTAVRKAGKSGVEVSELTGDDAPERLYRLLDAVYAAQKMKTPNSEAFFEDIWDAFSPDKLRCMSALVDKADASMAMVVTDKGRAYYITGASDKEHKALYPSNLLQWEIIRRLKSDGIREYDFVGSDLNRLAKFKRSFGGTLRTNMLIEKRPTKAVSFAVDVYGRIKTRFRYL